MSQMSGSAMPAGLGYYGLAHTGALAAGSSGGVSVVRLQAYAREATDERPHGVVNDYVASTLGRLAGVSVPPGMLVELGGDTYGYVSLAFGHKGEIPPPVIPNRFAEERPWDTTAIILFDQWVGNTDRHDGNLAYLPRRGVAAFDHDLSLIGRCPADIRDALEGARDQEIKGHLLAPYLQTARYFEGLATRINSITSEEIRRPIRDCEQVGLLSSADAQELVRYVEFRQVRTLAFVERTIQEYKQISSWPMWGEEGGQ